MIHTCVSAQRWNCSGHPHRFPNEARTSVLDRRDPKRTTWLPTSESPTVPGNKQQLRLPGNKQQLRLPVMRFRDTGLSHYQTNSHQTLGDTPHRSGVGYARRRFVNHKRLCIPFRDRQEITTDLNNTHARRIPMKRIHTLSTTFICV